MAQDFFDTDHLLNFKIRGADVRKSLAVDVGCGNRKLNAMNKKLPFVPNETDAILYVIISVLLLMSVNQVLSQPQILGDLNQSEDTYYNEYSYLTGESQRLYFISEGTDLYSSETINGMEVTKMVKRFTSIGNLLVIGSVLYFRADDGIIGPELWKSDGTQQGTSVVKDIRPGAGGSSPESLVDVNGHLYFIANNGTTGKEVWKSNGTNGGTVLVKDVFPKGGSSNPAHLTNVNGKLFFAANDGSHGYELWMTDGTAAGTVLVKDIRPESKVGSSPEKFAAVGNTLFFSANDPVNGRELWKSDGTGDGTVLVKDIRAGTSSSVVDNTVGMNDVLYFTATDGISGHELWRSDGTSEGTYLLKDMTPGGAGSHGEVVFSYKMGNFTSINGLLFYTAYKGNDYYIWKSDGTSEGTVTVEICHGPGIGQPKPQFSLVNGKIYYFNINETEYYWYGLSRMNADGTSPETIYGLSIDAYDYDYPLTAVVGNNFYFSTRKDYYSTGFTIFKTTEGETRQLSVDTYQGTLGSYPANFTKLNGKVLFSAQDGWTDNLYITDGTPGGTVHLDHPSPYSYVNGILTVNNKAYVSYGNTLEIWQTDGTEEGTTLVAQDGFLPANNMRFVNGSLFYNNVYGELWKINPDTYERTMLRDFNAISRSVTLGSALLVSVKTENNGEELWRTNGTTSGTYRFKTIRSLDAYPTWMESSATIRNTHFFIANDGIHGNELWRTQGTGATTYMVSDLNTSDGNFTVGNYAEFDIAAMAGFRDSLYISAVDNSGRWSLLKTNGTATGFKKVTNLDAVQAMIPVGRSKMLMFVFRNSDRSHVDLWVTDGTSDGTRLINSLGSLYYPSIDYEIVDNEVYFMLGDGKLWKSDGTECGTYATPLEIPTQKEFGLTGDFLIFSADQQPAGYEPHSFNLRHVLSAPCDASLSANAFGEAEMYATPESFIRQAPNPFANDFSMTISGNENETAQVEVYTMAGVAVEKLLDLSCNKEYRLGNSWKTGMYIIKVNKSGVLHTEKVIKR